MIRNRLNNADALTAKSKNRIIYFMIRFFDFVDLNKIMPANSMIIS